MGEILEAELRYLDDRALVSMFDRFTVFARSAPRQQIRILALDEEHAIVEGANHLGLARHRVAVIRTPGFLDSNNVA